MRNLTAIERFSVLLVKKYLDSGHCGRFDWNSQLYIDVNAYNGLLIILIY